MGGMGDIIVPGPLTLRMMERVVSSMNSTRTWVTPPREPASQEIRQQFVLQIVQSSMAVSEWSNMSFPKRALLLFPVDSFSTVVLGGDGGLSLFCYEDVPVRPRTRVTLTSLTGTLADSIVKSCVMS